MLRNLKEIKTGIYTATADGIRNEFGGFLETIRKRGSWMLKQVVEDQKKLNDERKLTYPELAKNSPIETEEDHKKKRTRKSKSTES
jgi:hypothetical protein